MAKKAGTLDIEKLMAELNPEKTAKENSGEAASTAPVQKKSGFVTLIGRPNVGKSTLMNHLIGQKIAITSQKPQTTRNRIQTVYTDERGQIIFLDTPGIHKAKNKLGEYMVNVAEHTLKEVDVILWLVEPTYKDVCRFAEIVPVSALRKRNTDLLTELIFKYLPYGPMFYDEDTVTDQPMRQIAAELIREKALRLLDEEIPHGIAVTIERMSERPNGMIDIDATIVCERDSHKGIIIGKGGAMLKKIGSTARREIEAMMETKVNLQLWVKVRKEWRDSEILMKNYGYNPKE